MKPKQLLARIGAHVCEHGSWPLYQALDIKLIDGGGLEPLLAQLDGVVGVRGRGHSAHVFLDGADNYIEYAPCGAGDLQVLAQAAPLFAESAARGADGPNQIPQVTAAEIQQRVGVPDSDLRRVLLAVDEYGQVISSGGTRGDDISVWSFGASEASPYFQAVSSWSEFEEARRYWESTARLRAQRESNVLERNRPYDRTEATTIARALDEILARVAKLEALKEEELRELRQEVQEIKEDLATLNKKQAGRSVRGFIWRVTQLGLQVDDVVEFVTKYGSKLLPPG